MATRPLETLLALKAICLCPGLTSNDRRVGAAIIEHFNRRTSQCDPSIGRLARLLAIHTRTVSRSIDDLVAAGLFERLRHAGHSGRNSYAPLWPKFREICGKWDQGMKRTAATSLSAQEGQMCRAGDDTAVNQTCGSNPLNKTCKSLPREKNITAERKTVSSVHVRADTLSQANAAEIAAERRWTSDLHKQFAPHPVTYGEIIGLITPEFRAGATETELRKPGSGLNYICSRLGLVPRRER